MTDGSFNDSNTCTPDTTDIDSNALTLKTCYVDNKRKLGSGAHGEVLVGIAAIGRLKMELAVKRVNISGASAETNKAVKCLRNEINIMKRLKHKNIVQFYGADEDIDYLCIFMELMPRGSVKDFMVKNSCALTEDITATYTYQILEGLVFLHANEVVHRDIKCANVLLQTDNSVKISDFGVSKEMDTIRSTLNSFVGTPNWMAPEQIHRKYKQEIDICWSLRCPIWLCDDHPVWELYDVEHLYPAFGRKVLRLTMALGCTVVEMRTQKPPWSGRDGTSFLYQLGNGNYPEYQLPEESSKEIEIFLEAVFKTDPKDRPSATELLQHPFIKRNSTLDTEAGIENLDVTDIRRNVGQEERSPRLMFENVEFNSSECFRAYVTLRRKIAPLSHDLDSLLSICGIKRVVSTLQEKEENDWFSENDNKILTVAYTESIQTGYSSGKNIDHLIEEGHNIIRKENASARSTSMCELNKMFGNKPAPTVIVACMKEHSLLAQHINKNSRFFIVLINNDMDVTETLMFTQGNFARQTIPRHFVEALDDLFEMMIFDTVRAKVTLLTRILSESETSNTLDNERMQAVLNESNQNPYIFVMDHTLGIKEQEYLYRIRSYEDNIRSALYQAKALYNDSNVPKEDMADFLKEIDEKTTEQIMTELSLITNVIAKSKRFGKIGVFIDENVCDDMKEKTRIDCKEVMKRHGILERRYEFQYVSKNMVQNCGGILCGSNVSNGTLGGFAYCDKRDTSDLYALTSKHIAILQPGRKLSFEGRTIGTFLKPIEEVGLDIAVARIDDIVIPECRTEFQSRTGKFRQHVSLDDTKLNPGQLVHIWGATTRPGLGVLSSSNLCMGIYQHLIIESRNSHEPFCNSGDSGAIVLTEDRMGNLYALGMVMGELVLHVERNESACNQYVALPLKEGLDELSRVHDCTFQLAGIMDQLCKESNKTWAISYAHDGYTIERSE